MFIHNINPTLLHIGPLEIRYYGLVYSLSFLLIYFVMRKLSSEKKIKLKENDVEELLIYLTLGMIIGARTFYFLIYDLSFFLSKPWEFFMIWHGGMSFHGALTGIILATFLFSRKKKIHFYELADILVIPFSIALFFGRIANFINGELYGRITNVSWCVKFPSVDGCRHPSQLYEAVKNLFIFSVLWNIKDKKLPKGIMFWSFITMYGVLRFIIEFFREPDITLGYIFGWMTMGQILCIIMTIVGVFFIISIYKKEMKMYE